MADDPTTSHPVTPEPQAAVPGAPGVAPSPTAAPNLVGRGDAPVQPVQPVATPAKPKSGASGRWLNVLLGVALVFAIGGVAFAIGRTTAPASAATGGRGNFNGGFRGWQRADRELRAGRERRRFFGGRGARALTGTVASIDGDKLTITTDNGQTVTLTTADSTTYHTRPRPPRPMSTAGTRSRCGASDGSANGGTGNGNGGTRGRRHRTVTAATATGTLRSHRDRVSTSQSSRSRGRLTAVHLLVIEDDLASVACSGACLSEDRHVVELATDGGDGLDIAAGAHGLDAVILDLGLPDIAGLEVARRLRASGSTCRSSCSRHVTQSATGSGAWTPAVTTTWSSRSPSRSCPRGCARLRAGARNGARRAEPKLAAGRSPSMRARRRVTLDGRTVDLSPREFALLECLLRHPGQMLSRDQLLDQAWPFGVAVTWNAVDAYIQFLARSWACAGRRIETVRGVGYRLADA